MTGPIDEVLTSARQAAGENPTPHQFFSTVREHALAKIEEIKGAADPAEPEPLPPGFFPMYGLDPRGGYRVPEYEAAQRSNSGKIVAPLVLVVEEYLTSKFPDKLAEDALEVLRMIVAIAPPDPLLADYRALRLRGFFEAFVRTALNAVVSPDGASNAARIISADGGFRRDAFSELGRFMLAALTSGTDRSLAGAVRVYVEAVR